jgi:hypothetical protein
MEPCLDMPAECIYDVTCDCGFVGMREDCFRGFCPNCGDRIRRAHEKKVDHEEAAEVAG